MEAARLRALSVLWLALFSSNACVEVNGGWWCSWSGQCVFGGHVDDPGGGPSPPPYSFDHNATHWEHHYVDQFNTDYVYDGLMTAYWHRNDGLSGPHYPTRRARIQLSEQCGYAYEDDITIDRNITTYSNEGETFHLVAGYANDWNDCIRYEDGEIKQVVAWEWEYEWENSGVTPGDDGGASWVYSNHHGPVLQCTILDAPLDQWLIGEVICTAVEGE